MERTIEIAKCTLADLFNIKKSDFDRKTTRRYPVVEARRFLIYFLVDDLSMKFSDIPKVMNCITSHASAMHHFYKMMNWMDMKSEEKLRLKYREFKQQMLAKGMDKLEKELLNQYEMRKTVNRNIRQLKKMIDEA
tara:strand:+ start:221 stop:625 length:405 start_codon:yes stop_codon:yes gene_type:complete